MNDTQREVALMKDLANLVNKHQQKGCSLDLLIDVFDDFAEALRDIKDPDRPRKQKEFFDWLMSDFKRGIPMPDPR